MSGELDALLTEEDALRLSALTDKDKVLSASTAPRERDRTTRFFTALEMNESTVCLAMLRAFIGTTGLSSRDDWSVSALPQTSRRDGIRRFSTVSKSNYEVMLLRVDRIAGSFIDWNLRFAPGLIARAPDINGVGFNEIRGKHDALLYGRNLESFFETLADPVITEAIRTNIAKRGGGRHTNWHNPELCAYLTYTSSTPLPTLETDTPDEIEVAYAPRLGKQRLHQRALRILALQRYPNRCDYCGLSDPAILDVAHIVPDSQGGAASLENVRLLCANHHRAQEAGYLVFRDDHFHQVSDKPHIPPEPRTD